MLRRFANIVHKNCRVPSNIAYSSVRAFSTENDSETTNENTSGRKPRPFKSSVYTRTGDKGTSQLYNLKRHPKDCDYFQSLGHVDELNANIGVAFHYAVETENGLRDHLSWIQSRLFDLGACIATPRNASSDERIIKTEFDAAYIDQLERWIDDIDSKLPRLNCFILPSGGACAGHLHVCRAVCRRAERSVVELVRRDDLDEAAMRFLNRLSDYFFVAARHAARHEGIPETEWYKEVKSNKHDPADLDA